MTQTMFRGALLVSAPDDGSGPAWHVYSDVRLLGYIERRGGLYIGHVHSAGRGWQDGSIYTYRSLGECVDALTGKGV